MKPFIFISIIFISIAGCDDSLNPNKSDQFYPLKVGSYWTYRLIQYDSTGTAIDQNFVFPERVVRDSIINGEKWYIINSIGYLSLIDNAYINKSDGFYTRSGNKVMMVYKYPARKNEIFGDSVKVVETNQTVSTIAGNFNCVTYQTVLYNSTLSWVYQNTYVAPGYGKVKIEYYSSKDQVTFTKLGEYNLESYRVN